MWRSDDNQARALWLSIGVHAGFFAALATAVMSCEKLNSISVALRLPDWFLVECVKPISVQGPIIEATLVNFSPKPPEIKIKTRPTPPKPKLQNKPVPKEQVAQKPKLPPLPQNNEDRIDREKVDELGEIPPEELLKQKQEEKRKREQELLEEQKRLAEMKKQAERQKKADEKRLQELLAEEQAEMAGTEGDRDDLTAHYMLALQQAVYDQWTRPETARAGLNCMVKIAQIPGGEVISATVVRPCDADELTKRSIEAAVLKAQPLPYEGFEPVFVRNIEFVFHYEG